MVRDRLRLLENGAVHNLGQQRRHVEESEALQDDQGSGDPPGLILEQDRAADQEGRIFRTPLLR
jgi:hypothetical protein